MVGSGCPSRCRRCHWTRIAVLRVCGPPVGLVVLSPRPSSLFVALVPGIRPGCRSMAPRGEVCRNGPCLGRCIPCGWGSVYACTARCLWIDSWFGRCSPCVMTGPVLVSGRRRLPVLCGCSMCFGYTPCGPGSGYAGVLRYLRSGWWHCSRYVVIGFGLVSVPVGVVSLPPVLSPPPGARVRRRCRGHSSCGRGSLDPGVRRVPRWWDVGVACLVRASCFRGLRDHRGRWGVVSPLGWLLMACSALRVSPGRRRPGAPAPSCSVFALRVWSSCVSRMWVWRLRLYVHLPFFRRVLSHACVHLTGLVGGIPLALGVGVSGILFACCIARYKWRSLSSVSSSHVEVLRHIRCGVRSRRVAAFFFVVRGAALRILVALSRRVGRRGVVRRSVVVALRRVVVCAVLFRCVALGGVLRCRALAVPCRGLCCFCCWSYCVALRCVVWCRVAAVGLWCCVLCAVVG